MTKPPEPVLPVDEALPALLEALAKTGAAVLVAPPGAGKTTRVPVALLDAGWLGEGRIVILEPRRIAARAAAQRMASLRSEAVGETIGLRARFDTRIGPRTRIEVVTEGVFTRMILADPTLEGIGCVIFDEFHERSLDADLGLALALDARFSLRADLRLIVMSATLSGARVAALLDDAPVIESQGRMYPVDTRYIGRDAGARFEDQMSAAILRALRRDEGSILAFLPGQGEIRRTEDRLRDRISDPDVMIAPLYGAMDPPAQDRAISPAPAGRRKVVLATAIAETSLTIDGVRIVIDGGLSRLPRFEPGAGVTRLATVRAAKASIDQRRGRAGRTAPGVCYRLWDEPQTRSLPEFAEPEIRAADLSGLLIDCADWGVTDPLTLRWLDAPPVAALDAARASLVGLGALDPAGGITPLGRSLRRLPLPPRLAGMVASAARHAVRSAREAAEVAALLVERGLGGTATDLTDRLEQFRRDRSERAKQMRDLADNWARLASKAAGEQRATGSGIAKGGSGETQPPAPRSIAGHLLEAFPDRIAKARGEPGHFILAGGRGVRLDPTDPLARVAFLVVAELQGAAAATRILAAAPASEDEILQSASSGIEHGREVYFDIAAKAVRARSTARLGAIVLASTPESLESADAGEIQSVLAGGFASLGIAHLPWSRSQSQLRHRAAFVRAAGDETFPDLSDAALNRTVSDWLAAFLEGKTRAADVTAGDLDAALQALVPWSLKQRLDEAAPTHFLAPTGERHPIDYDGAGAPALHIRVQELFGLKQHPAIADGRLPLTLNLLSPAHRPIQITRDLPGFWAGSWAAVKSEMKGRYPRHVWPDDPANAAPTRRAKPRSS
ncbi:MAG: ATP-dependent helicase HrpB [Alphaproteobacteria bacterium]|nr:ATP-dependent helicase HrpB [Alphaproteobacteria bacterium]